jgi:hypothetical protein
MKKKVKKLTLHRDVLRTAAPSELAGVVGGISIGCSSENCTTNCPTTGTPRTYCVCPDPG